MIEARLYTKNPDKSVECFLCHHRCHIKNGGHGICMVRENKDGVLYSTFYGHPCALAVDPIEKKPLFHFYPGTKSFSIATLGCNFQCEFCQNWDISQYGRNIGVADFLLSPPGSSGGSPRQKAQTKTLPEEVVGLAQEAGCKTISYTYSEPTIFYEYAKDIAELAKPRGIANVFVTNGYMTREMLDDFHPCLAAANIDLKAFKKETYRKIIKADLNGVLDSISYMKGLGIWIEITTLIVPQMNDDEGELRQIAEFIASVGIDTPWHISRFHPQYKMLDRSSTPADIMRKAYDIGKTAGLKYVYMGNVPHGEAENTFCWNCGEKLIERSGFSVAKNILTKENACPKCKSKIDGIF
ncbi:MAG: AmmeMemoRadiSam system radical SAM enzyme [Deltaproteobacteria bacterium RIFCSPLOWO2_02_FULL_47_10]|nr:MAG: AmmeMemoRadiSam system radical SAM enzyme [Deltaproteobacteria bacterium RIFCSPLOWO2_02_FULL_47_10]